ncbi:MAG: hypothetical protein ABIF87_07125 [Pseudomonadota bacterium]
MLIKESFLFWEKRSIPLTKEHIVDSVRNRLDLPKYESPELIETLLKFIKKILVMGRALLSVDLKTLRKRQKGVKSEKP